MAVGVTVFTGFLGAGKTTIILDAVTKLAAHVGYNVVVLKNEFGDVAVDALLGQNQSIKVAEMLNGCLCCVLVGQMQNALKDIKSMYGPDRIIIESSGSAFPAPIAWQIRQLEPEFKLDSIVTVIDCLNFTGYADTSYTAKLQAAYTDVILLNKHELVTETQLERVLDYVYDLNEDTPKIKYHREAGVDLDLLFGLDTQLFKSLEDKNYNQLDETKFGVYDPHHHAREVDIITIERSCSDGHNTKGYHLADLEQFLNSLNKECVYRVKGLVLGNEGERVIVNHAFGRCTLIPIVNQDITDQYINKICLLTVMGVDLQAYIDRLKVWFGVNDVKLHKAH